MILILLNNALSEITKKRKEKKENKKEKIQKHLI